MRKHTRPMSPWLLGLVLAVVIFVLVLVVLNVLGFGDDPVVDTEALGGLIRFVLV